MDAAIPIYIVIIAILICLSAFFSMSETAFTSVNEIKLKKMANDGDAKAQKALQIIENYDKLITTVLIGNNLVNIASTSLATIIFAILLGADTGAIISTLVMTIVLLTLSEITPKSYAKRNPEKVCIAVCSVMYQIIRVFSPLSWAFTKLASLVGGNGDSTITEDELEVMIDEIQGEGVLEKSESELIKSAMRLDDTQISEILVPRVDIVGIEVDSTVEELGELFFSSGFSRIPVYDDNVDDIIGFVHIKEYYNNIKKDVTFSIRDILVPIKYYPDTITVAAALSELRKSKTHIAVVLDSYGGTEGLITMEDIIEALVGEIWDENDQIQQDVVATGGGKYLVKGDANVFEVMETIGVHFDPEEYDETSVSGYVMYKLGRAPTRGDEIELENISIKLRKVKDHRMMECEMSVKE